MKGVRFAIMDWAAEAPGLHAPSDWQAWARAPQRPEGALQAKLEAMPAMQRRRLNALGRAAAQVAWDCHVPDSSTPVVFASGYGDAQRGLHLLKEFAASGVATPTDFTFSVHNAIGAMYSISRSDSASYISVAAGAASAAAGVVEACALLADGARQVLLVCYDAPPCDEYAAFAREAPAAYAWAWRITPAETGKPHFGLEWAADDGEEVRADLPFGLQALQFTLSDAMQHSARAGGSRWTWSRHA